MIRNPDPNVQRWTRIAFIDVIGTLWDPQTIMGAYCRDLTDKDISEMEDSSGNITRESARRWVGTNSPDFSRVIDYSIVIGNDVLNWENEDSDEIFAIIMEQLT